MSALRSLSFAAVFAVVAACGGDAPMPRTMTPDMDSGLDLDAGYVEPLDNRHDAGACTDPGCACEEDSEPINCYPPPILSPTGTNLCAQGSQYCRDGVWSQCQSLIQFGLNTTTQNQPGASSNGINGIVSALIAPPTTCNPCHPSCFDSLDRPTNTDLSNSNTSTVVIGDAGADAGDAGRVYGLTYDPVQAGVRLTILSDTAQRGGATTLAVCGNGILENKFPTGFEQCDDGNTRAGDGCDNNCLLETGYYCPTAGSPCVRSVCGNGVVEGLEACDDGNNQIGDGCTPQCAQEPTCIGNGTNPCTPVCGDGKKFPSEGCDDGNVRSGDGCSSTCVVERGFTCSEANSVPPPYIDLPIVYRDFVGPGLMNIDAGAPRTADGSVAFVHYDFEDYNPGQINGLVGTVGSSYWDTDAGSPTYKKPVAALPLSSTHAILDATAFSWWYTTNPTVNITYADTLRVSQLLTDGGVVDGGAGDAGTSSYAFDTTAFFPLDGRAGTWPSQGKEKLSSSHDFSFTSEVRFWFIYTPPQTLDFRGDDDVWVFINGKLAVDIGGVHSPVQKSITLNSTNASTYNLVAGNLYEAAVFQAERHTNGSNYRLTLAGFFSGKSTCVSHCGDGIVTPDEFCDDGSANGQVGACLPDCTGRAPKYAASASYWRDYTAVGTCTIPPERPLWGNLTWVTTNSSGGAITFQLQGAETAAAVPSATIVPVTVDPSTGGGAINVQQTLQAAGVTSDPPYLRVTAVLQSSSNQSQTPVLNQFDTSFTCVNVE